jgi:putative RecB family exonuclease
MSQPARLVKVSATKLSTWQDCPRKFFYTYVDRRPRSTWAHLSYGNAIHLALRDAYGDDDSFGASADELVTRHWSNDGFRDAAQSEYWRGEAIALVARYVKEGPGRSVHSTERTLGARTGTIAIDTRIDRIDIESKGADEHDELVVVDYKTGRRELTQEHARGSMALAFYVLAVRQSLRRTCNTVELHHLPSGERITWTHDDASLERQVSRAEEIAAEMQRSVDSWEGSDGDALDALFPATPGPLCGFCDVRSSCAVAAGPQKDPWSGLGDEQHEPR